jgi:hypothetical protein
MADYDIGYGKPPINGRFKPGVSGNPKGRSKHRTTAIADIVKNTLDAPIKYREGGRTKFSTYRELSLKMLVEKAIVGDQNAAELALKILAQAERYGDPGADPILVENWLADYAGQTAAEKTDVLTVKNEAETDEWWKSFKART